MIYSMTGYGRGERGTSHGAVRVEIKTINHRSFEVGIKLPETLTLFEDKVREHLQKKIKRGRVHLTVTCGGGFAAGDAFVLNERLASSVVNELKRLKKKLGLHGEIDINTLIALPGVVTYEPVPKDTVRLWRELGKALDKAISALLASRAKEGNALAGDMMLRIGRIDKHLKGIEARSEVSINRYKNDLAERVKKLSGGLSMDNGRLEQEVALFAKNTDITEEITRLKSHIDGFRKELRSGGEKGKSLDFIAQELSREANTIGAKSADIQISRNMIAIKSQIDKIREQLKNIE